MPELPMDPEQRNVVHYAHAALAKEGRYRGLLPLGQYAIGEHRFDIFGGPRVELVVK